MGVVVAHASASARKSLIFARPKLISRNSDLKAALQQRCPTAEFQSLEPPIGAPGTIQGAGVGQFELFHRQDFFRLRMSPAATILRHTCSELGSHSLCPAAICNDHVWEAGAQAMCWGFVLGRQRFVFWVYRCMRLLWGFARGRYGYGIGTFVSKRDLSVRVRKGAETTENGE